MPRININGISMHFVDQGAGMPVLLVHGFPFSQEMWHHQIDELAIDYRVIAPDLRGYGESGFVNEPPASMDLYADDLSALLKALEVTEPVVFCGLSMGGYVAWSFYRRHREQLRALILCDTRAAADSAEVKERRHKLARIVVEQGTGPVAEAMLPNLFSDESLRMKINAVQEIKERILATDPEVIAAGSLAMAAREDSTGLLSTIDLPTMVLVGEHDKLTSVEEMLSVREQIPGAQYREISNAGHLPPLEHPSETNEAMKIFLKSLK